MELAVSGLETISVISTPWIRRENKFYFQFACNTKHFRIVGNTPL